MQEVGVRELRQNLSVWLRRVGAGEAFRVTEHGHPVALLQPLPMSGDPLDELTRAGVVQPARGTLADVPPPLPPTKGPTLSDELRAMRDEDDR